MIHTYSGFENKVKQSIEQRVAALGVGDAVSQVMIPTETVVELKKGKRREASQKFFPGYVLIRMDMSDDLWYLIKNTPKVTGFVGPGVRPTPIPEEQVRAILQQVETGAERPEASDSLQPGRERSGHRRTVLQLHRRGGRGQARQGAV